MLPIPIRIVLWLLILVAAIVAVIVVAPPVIGVYLGVVAIVSPVIIATLPWARSIVWKLVGEYLIRRRVAWVSFAGVALCVALVLVVLSVMGGWLEMFRNSFKTLTGDLIVSRPALAPFAYYDEMIAEFEKLAGVEAAIPIIKSAGLLYLDRDWQDYVGVVGVPEPRRMDRVMKFTDSLWFQHGIAAWNESKKPLREPATFDLWDDIAYEVVNPNDPQAARRPGIILGSGAINVRKDKETGKPDWPEGMQYVWGRLTVLPADTKAGSGSITSINAVTTPYWVVDGSRTQTMQHDNNVYVPFEQLQKDLGLSERPPYEDLRTGRMVRDPARTSEIHVKVRAGFDPLVVRRDVEKAIERVLDHELGVETKPTTASFLTGSQQPGLRGLRVETWQEKQRTFLNAIENEIALTTSLFSLISVVAVLLIFCIFYMIVMEKTRDIGILKSVGAGAWDIAQIFLAYGTAIGFVGGGIGVALGTVFVHRINDIHAAMGRFLGIEIWNSEVYAFDKIPNEVNLTAAGVIWLVGIIAAIGGALLPAVRAAMLNPVESLRFE